MLAARNSSLQRELTEVLAANGMLMEAAAEARAESTFAKDEAALKDKALLELQLGMDRMVDRTRSAGIANARAGSVESSATDEAAQSLAAQLAQSRVAEAEARRRLRLAARTELSLRAELSEAQGRLLRACQGDPTMSNGPSHRGIQLSEPPSQTPEHLSCYASAAQGLQKRARSALPATHRPQ